MALWQYTFHVLPNENLNNVLEKNLSPYDEEGFDDSDFWINREVSRSYFKDFSQILPPSKSWSATLDIYGNLNSNCIEVSSGNELVESVSFRIDFTTDYREFVAQLIQQLQEKKLAILNQDLRDTPLDLSAIEQVIVNSPQYSKLGKLINGQIDKL